jgi:hypothetical protein
MKQYLQSMDQLFASLGSHVERLRLNEIVATAPSPLRPFILLVVCRLVAWLFSGYDQVPARLNRFM